MYVIIWEYHVRDGHVGQFKEIYSGIGTWAKLFQKAAGYLGTELIADSDRLNRYITIDRWKSSDDYRTFMIQWKDEYERLEADCAGLTNSEALLGKGEIVLPAIHLT